MAGWSNSVTFAKFYEKPVDNTSQNAIETMNIRRCYCMQIA